MSEPSFEQIEVIVPGDGSEHIKAIEKAGPDVLPDYLWHPIAQVCDMAESWIADREPRDRLSSDNAALRERVEALEVLVKQLEARDGRPMHLVWNDTEWVDDRCGCRYHPDDDNNTHGGGPHVHECAAHEPQEPS